MEQRVTLQTIADEAGVSKQTVSNAFSRPDQLSIELRERILETADRLGYSGPDPSARALSRGSTGVIGVLLTERTTTALGDPAAAEFLVGVSEALEERQQNMLLISGRPDELPPSPHGPAGTATGSTAGPVNGASANAAVANAAVDGIIAYSLSPNDPQFLAARQRSLPMVVVDQPRLPTVPFVGADQETLTRTAAEHLVSLGHTGIGVLALRIARDGRSGLVDDKRLAELEFPVTGQRLSGIAAAGCAPLATWECPDARSVAAGIDHLIELGVTAILAMSDVFALAAFEQLRQRGRRIPDDVSVIGIDDIPAAAAAGLTTVAQGHRQKGLLAVQSLTNSAQHNLTSTLVTRTSTASA